MYEVLKEDNPCPCNDCIIKMKCHTACPDYNKTNQHRIWHLRNDNYKLYQEYVKKIQTRFPNISIL